MESPGWSYIVVFGVGGCVRVDHERVHTNAMTKLFEADCRDCSFHEYSRYTDLLHIAAKHTDMTGHNVDFDRHDHTDIDL